MYGGRTGTREHWWELSRHVLEWQGMPTWLRRFGTSARQRQFCCFQLQGDVISCLKETGFVPTHDDLYRPTDRSANHIGGDIWSWSDDYNVKWSKVEKWGQCRAMVRPGVAKKSGFFQRLVPPAWLALKDLFLHQCPASLSAYLGGVTSEATLPS